MQQSLPEILKISDNVETRLFLSDRKKAVALVHHGHHHRLRDAVTWQLCFLLLPLLYQCFGGTITLIIIRVIISVLVTALEQCLRASAVQGIAILA